jgi:hypothetical protein
MHNKFGRFGTVVAWGTFLVLFGLLAVGATIGIVRLLKYFWHFMG